MKKNDLQAKTLNELSREADKLRVKLNKLRTDRYLGEVKNNREIRAIRKQLARTLTMSSQKKGKE